MDKKIILTGDRPTGKLHLGHYVGSLKQRVNLQNSDEYQVYIMIADVQALTDNFKNPKKIQDSIIDVALDYLAVGIDPSKTCIFIQSQIPELTELTTYYLNLVTVNRLERNPTIKTEIVERAFGDSIPAGFLCYPVSQASDITAFNASFVPVGEDQLPLIEQTREIVRSFNSIYGETLIEPQAMLSKSENERRLVGIDGNAKMSKSLGNCIYLSDSKEEVENKVMQMYTDKDHIKVEDPGKVEGNVVFAYLDIFVKPDSFSKYYNEFNDLDELKNAYRNGGIGDVRIKRFLIEVLEEELKPIRERREALNKDHEIIYRMLEEGSKNAREVARQTLDKVREAIGLEYFK